MSAFLICPVEKSRTVNGVALVARSVTHKLPKTALIEHNLRFSVHSEQRPTFRLNVFILVAFNCFSEHLVC